MQTTIDVDGAPASFDLDFEHGMWRSARELPEAAFPLVAEIDGKRYELYSDETFSEEELH